MVGEVCRINFRTGARTFSALQGDPGGPLLDVRPLMSSSCRLHAKDGRDKLRECSRSLETYRRARFQGHSLRGRTLHENVCSLSSRRLNARGGRSQIKREIIMLEPRAAWTAGVAHNPPLDRQASWHQCPTECQRVDLLLHVKHVTLEIRA